MWMKFVKDISRQGRLNNEIGTITNKALIYLSATCVNVYQNKEYI